ncbi:MAG: hypothetical protein AABY64_14125 [Bdellovibrionota bacterium]
MATSYEPGQKVNLLILRKTDLGFVAKINETDEGLLYHDEIFELLEPGQSLPGYIKKVRPDGGIDLLLQAFGNFGAAELGKWILEILARNGGFLPITAKTPPEKIYELFGISKKKYKIALGGLYKMHKVTVDDDGVRLVEFK